MRLVRFLLTSLAVIAGLIGAFGLLVIGFLAYVFLRLFGRPATKPSFRRATRTTPTRPAYSNRDDVIDVEARPVKE
jgi:hypothetical protein